MASVAFLLVPLFVLMRWSSTPAYDIPQGFPGLEETIGEWSLIEDQQLDENAVATIDPDAYMMRTYEAEGRASISVYVALYAGRAGYGKGAHDPNVCFRANGWEVVGSRRRTVVLDPNASLQIQLVDAEKEHSQQVVLYWFQPAKRWPARVAVEEFRRIVDAMVGNPEYAFIRLAARSGRDSTADKDLELFAKLIAPKVRGALDGLSRQQERKLAKAATLDSSSDFSL